jgi:FkbM family methyltransferase
MKHHPHGLTAEEIRGMVRNNRPVMIEIGSHEGSDTAKFLEAMPGLRIFCFEPDERAAVRFLEALGTDERVFVCPEAVSDVDGTALFYASTGKAGDRDDWDFSGSLNTPTGHLSRSPEIGFKEPAAVACRRLDSWLESRSYLRLPPVIDFIWADVQGAQRKVIAGAQKTLARTRFLYIECHETPCYEDEPTADELIALLPGFDPLATYERENILFQNRFDA